MIQDMLRATLTDFEPGVWLRREFGPCESLEFLAAPRCAPTSCKENPETMESGDAQQFGQPTFNETLADSIYRPPRRHCGVLTLGGWGDPLAAIAWSGSFTALQESTPRRPNLRWWGYL